MKAFLSPSSTSDKHSSLILVSNSLIFTAVTLRLSQCLLWRGRELDCLDCVHDGFGLLLHTCWFLSANFCFLLAFLYSDGGHRWLQFLGGVLDLASLTPWSELARPVMCIPGSSYPPLPPRTPAEPSAQTYYTQRRLFQNSIPLRSTFSLLLWS